MQTKTVKKVSLIIFIVLCIVIIVGITIYSIFNWNKVEHYLSGEPIYNVEQVKELCDDAYNQGNKANEIQLQRIDELQKLLDNHESKLTALTNKFVEMGYPINNVSDYITSLQSIHQELIALNAEISKLRTEIALYKQAWNDYTDKAVVTFIRENHNEQLIVAKGEKITKAGFSSTRILEDGSRVTTYYGWTLDGETIVDLTDYVVNESKTFYVLEIKE